MSRIPLLSRGGDIVSWALSITQRLERDYADLKLRTDSLDASLESVSSVIKLDISSVSSTIETRIDSLSAAFSTIIPAAWASFDGTSPPYTPTGKNINDVSRSATGAYWLYMLNPLQSNTIGVYGNCNNGILTVSDRSITSVKVSTMDFSGTGADFSYISVVVFGRAL